MVTTSLILIAENWNKLDEARRKPSVILPSISLLDNVRQRDGSDGWTDIFQL